MGYGLDEEKDAAEEVTKRESNEVTNPTLVEVIYLQFVTRAQGERDGRAPELGWAWTNA
jgi:hypothetical protein